jgi:hypothetical protein
MNRTTKRIGAIGTAAVAVMGTGIAFAAWTASGSGTAAATASNATDTLVVSNASTTPDLVPGGTGTVYYTVTRTTTYAVSWTHLNADTGAITSDTTGCGAADVTFTNATVSGSLAKNVLTGNFTAPGAIAMHDDAANACQDATFTIPVTVS